jgi:hypothetical protein
MVEFAGLGIEIVPIPAHAVQGSVIQNGCSDDMLKKLRLRRRCGLPFAHNGAFQGVHDDDMHLPGPLYESLYESLPLYDEYRLPGAAATIPR